MKVPKVSKRKNNEINEQVHELQYPVLSPDDEGDLENERYSLHCTIHKIGNV
jgi:hypothetical protein